MKLIAIRHAEVEANLNWVDIGQLDSPVTKRGYAQAEAIAGRLRTLKVDALYSSDIKRAVSTAEEIEKKCHLSIHKHAGLRERGKGVFEGLTIEERYLQYPEESAQYQASPKTYRIPGGESSKEAQSRIVKTLTGIAENHFEKCIVVVTHGGVLKKFLEHVLQQQNTQNDLLSYERYNTGYNEFSYNEGKWSLKIWGDISHLHHVGVRRASPSFKNI